MSLKGTVTQTTCLLVKDNKDNNEKIVKSVTAVFGALNHAKLLRKSENTR